MQNVLSTYLFHILSICLFHLPLMLLGIRSSIKADLKCTTAELVYGTTLRLPGDFFPSSKSTAAVVPDPLSYMERLMSTMSRLTATPPCHPSESSSRVPASLTSCTHVFIGHDAVCWSLQRPYNGPFTVIKCRAKYYIIQVNGNKYFELKTRGAATPTRNTCSLWSQLCHSQ